MCSTSIAVLSLYHRTFQATAILADGFRDAKGNHLTDDIHEGVWLSDVPLDIHEGPDGDTLLEIRIAEELVVSCEWSEAGKPYREFLVPAAVVNRYGQVRRMTPEEVSDAEARRWHEPPNGGGGYE